VVIRRPVRLERLGKVQQIAVGLALPGRMVCGYCSLVSMLFVSPFPCDISRFEYQHVLPRG
jgi:hypothetical protein